MRNAIEARGRIVASCAIMLACCTAPFGADASAFPPYRARVGDFGASLIHVNYYSEKPENCGACENKRPPIGRRFFVSFASLLCGVGASFLGVACISIGRRLSGAVLIGLGFVAITSGFGLWLITFVFVESWGWPV